MRNLHIRAIWLVSALVAGVFAMNASGSEAKAQDSASSCDVLEEIVGELFDADLSVVTFRPSEASGNKVCAASWEIPGIDTAEETRRAVTKGLRYNNEVTLTIMGRRFDTAEEAVADLERDVATLTKGITTTIAGRERTIKREFGDWIEGVGDKAIPTGNAVMVAANGIRFTTSASTTDDEAENQANGIELAKRIVEGL